MGCSLTDAAVIACLWGARAAPLPIVALLLAPRAVVRTGGATEPDTATIAYSGDAGGAEVRALEAPWFPGCTSVIVGATTLAITDAERFETIAGETWLRLRPGSFRLGQSDTDRTDIDDAGALLECAAMLGAMDHIVTLVIDHANTRQQFGRPIGKFQAVQHLIADAANERVVSEAALAAALSAFDSCKLHRLDLLSAKVQSGRAGSTVAAIAHQLLGAIGFTHEHELHRYTKRLWAWRDDWSRQQDCETEIGFAALSAGADGLWPLIVDAR